MKISFHEVELFGESIGVKAEVGQMTGMSAHGDSEELCRFVSCVDPERVKNIFLVHGEYKVQQAFTAKLERKCFKGIEIPSQHQEYEL
jgi:metallo-beta-lactamase family protein